MASRSSEAGRGAAAAAAALILLVATPGTFAAGQADRARTEALARRAGERLVALQREADRLASAEATLLNELRRLEVDRQITAEQLQRADQDLSSVQAEIAAATRRMRHLETTAAAERPELRMRLVEMYKMGRARYARMLLSAPDVRRLGRASRMVAALAKSDRERIEQYEQTLDQLKTTRAALELRQREAVAARAQAERAQAAAARAAGAQHDLIRDIDRRRDLNAQLAGELQAAQQKLQLALRDAAGGAAAADGATLPLKPFRGDLDWPLAGTVRTRFGAPAGTPGTSTNGVELNGEAGGPVAAVHDGTVAFAGSFEGFGNLVILDHGARSFSLYGDLLEIGVSKGSRVDRGQSVGSAGPLPGGGTGVYFELRIDGRPVDPLQWLRKK